MRPVEQTISEPQQRRSQEGIELSVVIPCLNEAEAIEGVIDEARRAMEGAGISGEIVVVDNRSTDGTAELAERAGARVVPEPNRGYGSAYRTGFASAIGTYIVMGDGDGTYDFSEIPRFVDALRDGADFVIGNRMDGLEPGSMPWLHRYVGNPVLTRTLNLFFGTGVRDAHCGLRAFRRDLLEELDLRSTGMELASEQVIRASKLNLKVRQLDIRYRRRKGESKLSSFIDGWRHLRFLLIHSPTWLFVVPGALMLIAGVLAALVVLTGVNVFGRQWEIHTLIVASMLCIIGAQILQLGAFGRAYAFYYLGERDRLLETAHGRLRLEHGLLLGGAVLLAGLAIVVTIVIVWIGKGFGSLGEEQLALVGLTLMVLGIQTMFGAFFLSILGLAHDDGPEPASASADGLSAETVEPDSAARP